MLYSAITCGTETTGFLGFDDCVAARSWKAEQIGTLSLFSRIVSMLLIRKEQQDAMALSEDFCMTIDNSSQCVYVVEPETFRILYRNKAMQELLGKSFRSEYCYREFAGRESPCVKCPMKALDAEKKYIPVEVQRPGGQYLLAQASRVRWKGRDACLITGTDITPRKIAEESLQISAAENAIVIRQSGKTVYRYDIAEDTAVNMLDTNPQLGLPNQMVHYAQGLLESGYLAPESEAAHREFLRAVRAGEPAGSYDILLKNIDGRFCWYHADYSMVYDSEGKPSRAILSFFDNSVQREKEIAYNKWQSKLQVLLDRGTPYMEVNLTQDTVERQENMISDAEEGKPAKLSAYTTYALRCLICREDADAYSRFFDRERMLGMFCAGQSQDALTYRVLQGGGLRWYQAELQMIRYPFSDDVKGFLSFHDVDAEMRERKRLEASATKDGMTGLLNRTALREQVDRILSSAPEEERYALFMIDLDNFKVVNDTLGHQWGDDMLIRVGREIRNTFRSGDLVARIGGDEFMAFMNGGASLPAIRRKANELLEALQLSACSVNTSASIGIASVKGGGSSFETLYRCSDQAQYAAKRRGKNQYDIWDEPVKISEEGEDICRNPIQLQTLLQFMDGGILLAGVEEETIRIRYVSPSLEEPIRALRQNTPPGPDGEEESLLQLVYPPDLAALSRGVKEAAREQREMDLVFRVGADGARWCRLRGKRLPVSAGGTAQLLGVISDVTDLLNCRTPERERTHKADEAT